MIEKGASQELINYRRVGGGVYKQILDFRFFLVNNLYKDKSLTLH